MENNSRWVPTVCRNCTKGPCPVRVEVKNGVAVNLEGNITGVGFDRFSNSQGRVCPKSYGMIQKLYNPNRVKRPMKRTNPKKDWDVDPGFVEITWDEALGTVADRLGKIRATDTNRLSVAPPGPQIFTNAGTWDAFLQAYGPTQYLGSGGSIRCDMAEHVFGNLVHGGFHCEPDPVYCNYLIHFGYNTAASGGAPETVLYNDARARGMKVVVVDPVFSLTAGKADEWLPIKPGTDIAFMLALIHVILHDLNRYDAEYLKTLTNSPYLVGNDGYFIRDSSGKILVWDKGSEKARPYDDPGARDLALEGTYQLGDGREARPALQKLKDHVAGYTPEWAEGITDIAAVTTRRIAAEYIEAARIGSTIQIDGVTLPLRPVAIKLGRGVTGQMLSYQCALSQHILAILVGGLEVPGGHGGGRTAAGAGINTGIGISPGPDGMTNLVSFPFTWPPVSYSGAETLLPYSKAYALAHPRHLAYRHLVEPPKNFPIPAPPEALIRYRCNPLTAVGEHQIIFEALRRIPFIVSFSYLPDEMTQLADIVLPEHLDLERYDLATYVRSATARRFLGVLLRQPAVEPVNDTMEISEILTELASRMGFLDEYNAAINEKLALNGENKVQAGQRYTWEEIMDRFCKSVSGGECDLEWFRSNGGYLKRVPVTYQYDVHLEMVDKKLRYPLPYMEHVKITGEELAANLKKVGVDWWPTKEYLPLPTFFPNVMEEMPEKYDFYVTTVRNAQFSWGSNIECPWLIEAADLMAGQQDIYMNTKAAKQKGIKDGDEICVESEVGKVKRKVKLTEGIRPDTLLIPGQFGQWAAPGSKETGRVSQVTLSPIRHSWTDHFMSNMQGQTVKAMVYKVREK